jgi:hypothetical protein
LGEARLMIATPVPPGVDPSTFKFVVNGRVVYEPFAKQVQYHQSPAPYPLYGGSKGCGKSKALRFDCFGPCLIVPEMKCLILRRMKKEMQRSHLRFVPKEAQALGAIFKPNEIGAGVVHFPKTGSLVEFGHCTHEQDIEQYLSAEYDRIEIDEIVTFTEDMYLSISTCARTTIPGLDPRVGGGTNPAVGKKHVGAWAKRRWILKDVTVEEDEDYNPDEYEYIPALPSDNRYLNQEKYQRQLNRLPPSRRAAYRDGDWDASEDGFFNEFRKLDKPPLDDGVPRKAHVREFARFTNGSPRYCGFDWGYQTDEGVCLWAVYDDDGHLYIEDEFVFNGTHRERYIVKEIAQQIAKKNSDLGLQVRKIWCDPKMGEASGHESVETRLSTFQKYVGRVPCVLGERDRENGWARLRAWLRNHPDGTPFLRVHPRCKSLIRSIGEVSVDDTNDEDLDTHGFDHPIDALRFLVSGIKAPVGARAPEQIIYPPDTVGALRQRLTAMTETRPVLGASNVRRHSYGS